MTAQPSDEIRSLKEQLVAMDADSSRFFTIDRLAELYSRSDLDSAEYYNQLNLDFAEKQQDDYYLGHALFRKGANRVFSNQLSEAISTINVALEPITRAKEKWLEARAHYYLGNLSFTTTTYAKAIFHYQRSMVLSDSLGWVKGRIDNRHNLGGLFFELQDYSQADEYFSEAKHLIEELGDTKRVPMALSALAEVALLQKDYPQVDSISRIIIDMADTLVTAEYHVPVSYMKLGQVRFKHQEYEEALTYFYEGLTQLEDPDLNYPGPRDMKICHLNYHIGATYFELGQLTRSKEYLLQSAATGRRLEHFAILRDASRLLWHIEQSAGNYQQALAHHMDFKTSSDSILNNETLKNMLKARVDHELAEREKQEEHRLAIVELRAAQKIQSYYWIIVVIVLGLAILVLLLLLQRSKTHRETLYKVDAQSKLETKSRELAGYVLQLMRKNELLMNISDRLKSIRKSNKQEQQKELLAILHSIAINSKEIGWEEFELRFREVHPSFYQQLATAQPNLTSNESRLCAFLKLNMTSKEISTFTFQSEHSIIQARSRLKKKLGLAEDQRLSQFIATL